MLSSLQALNAAGSSAPAARGAAFQPKVKPRARRASAAEENVLPTQESQAVTPAPAPASSTPAPATAPSPPVAPAPPPAAPPPTAASRPDARSRSTQSTLPQPTQLQDTSGPSSSAGPSSRQAAGSNPPSSSTVLNNETESAKGKRKRVSASPSPRQRRTDINVDEAIDPATMTMKDIIRLAEAKERKKQKEDAAKKQEQQASGGQTENREKEQAVPLAPQVEIIDGKIVINQQSLQVDARALNQDDVGSYRRVDETASKLNYHSYMKKTPRERWKPEETDLFYKSVQQFGTDFAVIERLFPGKTRRQIKAKYKKEERENPRRMSETIKRPKPGSNLAHYEELVSKLKAAAAAEKAAEDDFDFTWDINANKGSAEDAATANAGNVDEAATGDYDEGVYDEQESIVEDAAVPKKEDDRQQQEQQEQQDSKVESAATPPPPALFAYETELPFAFS